MLERYFSIHRLLSAANDSGGVSVPAPLLPAVDTGFQVHVCNVSSPFHFFVQSLKTYSQLQDLMHQLQVPARPF